MNKKILFAALMAVVVCGIVAATEDVGSRFSDMGCTIYNGLKGILPMLIAVIIIFAGVIYVVGQAFGAEVKQKAQSWAQNMIIGVAIAVIIVLAVPPLLSALAPELGLEMVCA